MRVEHERWVVDDLWDLEFITKGYLVHTRGRGREKKGTHTSFMPRNPFVNSAVSSIKSCGRGLL